MTCEEDQILPSSVYKENILESRNNSVYELLSSEKSYLKGLLVIKNVFYDPLSLSIYLDNPILKKKDLRIIFSDILSIINLSTQFLEDLTNRLENKNDPWKSRSSIIGDLTRKYFPFMKMYSFYLSNYADALFHFDMCFNDNNKCRKTQGLCRINSKKLPTFTGTKNSKNTPKNHPDYIHLRHSFDIIDKVAKMVNEGIKEQEMIIKILEIQKTLNTNQFLLAPGRKLLKQGYSVKKRKLYLFSDIFMMLRFGKFFGDSQVSVMPLEELKVLNSNKEDANVLKLVYKKEYISINLESIKEKAEWEHTLSDAITKRVFDIKALPPRFSIESKENNFRSSLTDRLNCLTFYDIVADKVIILCKYCTGVVPSENTTMEIDKIGIDEENILFSNYISSGPKDNPYNQHYMYDNQSNKKYLMQSNIKTNIQEDEIMYNNTAHENITQSIHMPKSINERSYILKKKDLDRNYVNFNSSNYQMNRKKYDKNCILNKTEDKYSKDKLKSEFNDANIKESGQEQCDIPYYLASKNKISAVPLTREDSEEYIDEEKEECINPEESIYYFDGGSYITINQKVKVSNVIPEKKVQTKLVRRARTKQTKTPKDKDNDLTKGYSAGSAFLPELFMSNPNLGTRNIKVIGGLTTTETGNGNIKRRYIGKFKGRRQSALKSKIKSKPKIRNNILATSIKKKVSIIKDTDSTKTVTKETSESNVSQDKYTKPDTYNVSRQNKYEVFRSPNRSNIRRTSSSSFEYTNGVNLDKSTNVSENTAYTGSTYTPNRTTSSPKKYERYFKQESSSEEKYFRDTSQLNYTNKSSNTQSSKVLHKLQARNRMDLRNDKETCNNPNFDKKNHIESFINQSRAHYFSRKEGPTRDLENGINYYCARKIENNENSNYGENNLQHREKSGYLEEINEKQQLRDLYTARPIIRRKAGKIGFSRI
ncbi:hypothetical protein BB560_002464 [Smittium megazygosporum]|uniref:DH domain-containing protein n=1 Tax=Smittium megazygosporum TaxID=133381 RepID=A0A2T9ZEN2_9FUNG|nr:hypothetical protein BB560_002464 [Smittium megazygosporum]